ncbi:hypothetical protein LTR08_004542 [Meristemomyces frigidus]|nr:hypothetical protein LTR08_004542 [Meristemomyces frigidus]
MRFSALTAAIAAPLIATASPIASITAASVCSQASSVLSALHALSHLDQFCTSYLQITPSTTTVTSTYTQPLTEVYGIVSASTASPDPPGTTTVDASPVSGIGAGTVTVTSVQYTFRTYTVTETDTSTVGTVCRVTQPAAKATVQEACDCLGVTTPTLTTTATVTTTGDVTIVTETETEIYSPTTTFAPTATVTESTSTSTVYSTYVTSHNNDRDELYGYHYGA